MKTSLYVLLAATLLVAASPVASRADRVVAGQKLDSGLGDLPHYSKWVDRTGRHPLGGPLLGESQDSGLGELPHYSKWVDRTGKDPLGRAVVLAGGAKS